MESEQVSVFKVVKISAFKVVKVSVIKTVEGRGGIVDRRPKGGLRLKSTYMSPKGGHLRLESI